MSTQTLEKISKTARVELKTSDAAKNTLRLAAAVMGVDLSSFILSAAVEQAEMVLDRQRRRELSATGWAKLNEALNSHPEPTSALVSLMRGNEKNGSRKRATGRKPGSTEGAARG